MNTPTISCDADLQHLSFATPPSSESGLLRELVDAGTIPSTSIKDVIAYRREHGTDLLDTIEQLGLLDRSRRPVLVAQQLGIPVAHIDGLTVDPGVLGTIPAEVAIKHRVFPLSRIKGKLVVAVANPADKEAIAAATFAARHPIEVVVVPDEDITRLIDSHFLSLEEQNLITELGEDGVLPHASVHDEAPTDVERRARQAPVVRLVDAVIRRAIRLRASDINIRPLEHGAAIFYRIDGEMMWQRHIPVDLVGPLVCRIKIMSGMNIAEHRLPQDGRIRLVVDNRSVDLRISTLPTWSGESAVLRVLDPGAVRTGLDELGLPVDVLAGITAAISRPHGLVLVTGPTGAGKTTTLYAALRRLNQPDVRIITIEDPVEYEIDGVMQVTANPAAGLGFGPALRAMLRQDPDVIMVGEIRDAETARIAVQAALTGHLVLSTLHTNDACGAVTRLIDLGVEPYLVAATVEGVLAQRLVRRLDPSGEGCRGRTGVFEWMPVSNPWRDLVGSGASAAVLRAYCVTHGMRPLADEARRLVKEGLTTADEAARLSADAI